MSDWFKGLKCGERLVERFGAETMEKYKVSTAFELQRKVQGSEEFVEGMLDYLEYHRVKLLGEVHGKD